MSPEPWEWSHRRCRALAVALVVLAVSSPWAVGQPSTVPVGRAGRVDVDRVVTINLTRLQRANCAERADAAGRLLDVVEAHATLRARTDLHDVVARQLVRERAALASATRMTDGAGAETACGEVLMLLGMRLVPHARAASRAALLSALVRGYYGPDSRFALDLARFGGAITGDTLVLATDEAPGHRANAFALMAYVLAFHADDALDPLLEPEQFVALLGTLRGGLDDDDANTRAQVIGRLVALEDFASLPAIGELARRDPSPMVRARARDAVMALGPR